MTVTIVVGAQWGDEGKGRVIDYLAERAEMVIRFQGGDNAGHTVVNEHGRFALHLIPCGIFYPHVRCLLGPGTVVNLDTVAEEQATLNADKHAYNGIRAGDLHYLDFLRQRLALLLPPKNRQLAFYDLQPFSVEEMMDLAAAWRVRHGERIVDTLPWVRDAVQSGQRVLLEGQLGVGRDVNWGIYPFTTASSPTAGGACVGAGIPPRAIDEVLGVVKAYSTSVGGGPFPTELHDEYGTMLQEIGREFGATTGRARRCGWFDGVTISYASYLNGFTGIAVTKLDVLDHFDEIKLCTGYRLGDSAIDYVPDTVTQGLVEPVYEAWPGWRSDTSGCRAWDELPQAARAYLRRIEELAEAPIRFVSVGPERPQMVVVSPSS
jgi:adenylosuccinate synthase